MDEQVPEWWLKPRTVSVVVDNDSWVLPYAEDLVRRVEETGDRAALCRSYDDVLEGGIAFFLGCTGVAGKDVLERNHRTLVPHQSDLPNGRGFAPLTWQILEGKSEVPICLIEAAEGVDEGGIVYRDLLTFQGHELCDELRHLQGLKIEELCRRYLGEAAPPPTTPQEGEPSYYRRRRPKDSELDPEKTLAEQFELLRVCDNKRYPAFFYYRGHKYVLQISKTDE